MTISRTLSHLENPNRYWLHLSGTDYYEITANQTLDITGSFTLDFLLQLVGEDIVPLDYILCTKGHPTDTEFGSIALESIEGHLQIWLHDEDSVNSLVYKTDTAILNTLKVFEITVTWDSESKVLKIYKDAVQVAISLQTGENRHLSASDMGNIRTNNSDFVFGQGIGKTGYVGKILGAFMANRVWSSSEIYTHYQSVKYSGSYPETGKIIFSSDRFDVDGYQLGVMNGDTTDPQFLYSSSVNNILPRWKPDGERIVFSQLDNNDISNVPVSARHCGSLIRTINKNGGDLRTGYSDSVWNPICGTYAQHNSYIYCALNQVNSNYISYSGDGVTPNNADYFSLPSSHFSLFIDIDANYLIYEYSGTTGSSHSLIRRTLSNNAQLLIDSNSSGQRYSHLRLSKNGTKIAYSKLISGFYQVFICNIDGSAKTQLTFDEADHEFCCFSPDDSKIIYSSNKSGKWQLYIANIDGSNERNISRNSFNDRYADWKA